LSSAAHLAFERDIVEIEDQISRLREMAAKRGLDVADELRVLTAKLDVLRDETYRNLTPMEQVQVARHPRRPYTLDYIEGIFTDWFELKGDRCFRNDEAIVGGWARLEGRSVMVIGHQKGRDMKENLRRNFGMPHPEGYRKALRLMKMAEKFGRPVVTIIDTPGAYPGLGSEERGIGEAIARNLREMAALRVPTISIVIGEGMSGGALGIGVTDHILMLEHAVYSVISPEGCAAILWRSRDHRERAAEALRLTSGDLRELGVADDIIEEPVGGAHSDWEFASRRVYEALKRHLAELLALDTDELLARRWAKYEAIGHWAGKELPRPELQAGSHLDTGSGMSIGTAGN
jgi:acetyl-CoA carboxylase carboxyl transferase subunit alpha